jgi:V/A-type H+-transporting ATPase subunit C
MNDSYAATRIHVMRTKLIKPDEYERLLKMSDKEVINYLQSTEYREDVDALSVKDLENLESVDKILSHHGERIMRKLERISSKRFKALLAEVLMRNDLWNIMVVAEAIAGENDTKEAIALYGRRGTLDPMLFAGAKTIKELVQAAKEHIPDLGEVPGEYVELMRALASRRSIAAKDLIVHRGTDRLFIDEQNISNIVRLKREGIPATSIIRMLADGGTLGKDMLEKAASEQTLEGALAQLRASPYRAVIERAIDALKEESLVRFENDLHKEIVTRIRKLTRLHPLGVEVLIHYLTEKDIERTNLRLLIKGKRLGLTEGFLREHLIV